MGTCNSKGETIIQSNHNNTHNNSIKMRQTDFDENDLKLIKSSWNQIRSSSEFKAIGANMMVK